MTAHLRTPSHHLYRLSGCITALLLILFTFLYFYSPVPVRSRKVLHQKRAYATLFSTKSENDTMDDPYFTAVRVLTYQLLHHPSTRTKLDIPLLVLVPPHVSEFKRKVLTAEGAAVIPIDLLLPKNNTFHPADKRWEDQFCKIRLFEMTEYDRILYIDTDMLLTKSLDGIWEEPVALRVQTTGSNQTSIHPDEAPLPSTYLFTGVSDSGLSHDFPPKEGDDINGGFWLMRPDITLFKYYYSLMGIAGRFESTFMEQSMLNYAHRRDGNMPWIAFPMGKWNVNWPNERDVEGGCASLHDKFWRADNKDWIDRRLVEMWWRMQGLMEGHWQNK
jgi:alpha-N-acetylglucosamine transferase